jgi:hypothetical protein
MREVNAGGYEDPHHGPAEHREWDGVTYDEGGDRAIVSFEDVWVSERNTNRQADEGGGRSGAPRH